MTRSWTACVLLALITFLVYWPAQNHPFVNYDDGAYVIENPKVRAGLTWPGVEWAFTSLDNSNWHPVTWMSHMLDCSIFGLRAGDHHLVSAGIHAANAVLLFVLLLRLTGAFWQSALVAALFAWHPLRVESVAWVAERKDVLSGFFALLSLIAYTRYAQERLKTQQPGANIKSAIKFRGPALDYILALLMFALGLMAKPMLVTLPFVFLLLDYWPLRRAVSGASTFSRWARLAAEKWPFFLLSAASCAVTIIAQQRAYSIAPLTQVPLPFRLENAVVSYGNYILKSICPINLAVLYPLPKAISWVALLASGGVLIGISWAAWRLRRRYPFLWIGWLWFLGMLVPVIGLVQVGAQAMADRYTYLPSIGLAIGIVFGVGELSARFKWSPGIPAMAAGLALAGCLFASAQQLSYWRNSEALFTHALSVTKNNSIAYRDLGNVYMQQGRLDDAIDSYHSALDINETDAATHSNLGSALLRHGQVNEAISQLTEAVHEMPRFAEAQYNLANALLNKGNLAEAVDHYRTALDVEPQYEEAHDNLGTVLLMQGHLNEALGHFQTAAAIEPKDAKAQGNLAVALIRTGRVDEGMAHFKKAVELRPGDPKVHNNLGKALLQQGKVDQARLEFGRTLELDPNNAEAESNIGAALLREGKPAEAIAALDKAVTLAPNNAAARESLATALLRTGRAAEAAFHFEKVLDLQPGNAGVLNDLAWILAASPEASLRDGKRAVSLAEQADRLTAGRSPAILSTLAASLAEAGRFTEATDAAQRALRLLPPGSDPAQVGSFKARIECYQSNSPYRDPGLTNPASSGPQ